MQRSTKGILLVVGIGASAVFLSVGLAVCFAGVGAGEPAPPLAAAATSQATAPSVATASDVAAAPAPVATAPAAAPAAESTPPVPARFDAPTALKYVTALAKIGVRRSGTTGEHKGADYIAARLRAMGYEPAVRTFKLPNGKTSRNVVARASGDSTRVIVLGAHMDSKAPSPGANDNGSGCGTLLEIARQVADRPHFAAVEFVFFGAEESIDSNPDHHHYGSRRYVKLLSATQRKAVAAMVSVDMVGTGSTFVSRTMGIGTKRLSNLLVRRAKADGIKLSYLRDPSTIGWSDHEPFERVGIPVSWLEWRNDPYYHTSRDTAARLRPSRVRRAGQVVLDFVLDADEPMLAALRP